jgi:hypothetical protein
MTQGHIHGNLLKHAVVKDLGGRVPISSTRRWPAAPAGYVTSLKEERFSVDRLKESITFGVLPKKIVFRTRKKPVDTVGHDS